MKIPEKEIELINKAKLGNEDAISTIIEEYRRYVCMNAKSFNLIKYDGEEEDLIQEGYIGLFKAIKNYNPSKKASFSTYAWICIRNTMISALNKAKTQKNIILTDALLESKDDSDDSKKILENYAKAPLSSNPEDIILTREKQINLEKYIENNFSDFEKEVCKYMIAGYSYREISRIMNKEIKKIDNAIQRIRKKCEKWLKNYDLI